MTKYEQLELPFWGPESSADTTWREEWKSWDDIARGRIEERSKKRCKEHRERFDYDLLPHQPARWEIQREKEEMLDELQDAVYDLKVVIHQAKEFNSKAQWVHGECKMFLSRENAEEIDKMLKEQWKCLDVEWNYAGRE